MNPLTNPMALIGSLAKLFSSLTALLRDRMLKKAGKDEEKVKVNESIISDVEKVKDAKVRAANNRNIIDKLRKRYKL